MKDRDKLRFRANIIWFNQFFDGLRQIYQYIAELLPAEDFPEDYTLSQENYYYPSFKAAPAIPPYYALMLEGKKYALQVVSVIDASLFAQNSFFVIEPSMVVVVVSQRDHYARIDELALKVIKNQDLDQVKKTGNIIIGNIIEKFPTRFFAFQVEYDRFTDEKNPEIAISKYIIDPVTSYLEEGFAIE